VGAALASLATLIVGGCGFDGPPSGVASAVPEAGALAEAGAPTTESDAAVAVVDAGVAPDAQACVDGVGRFDGVDDVVTALDADALDLAGDLTVEAWVKPALSLSESSEMQIASHHDYEAGTGWVLLLDGPRVEFILYGSYYGAWDGYFAGGDTKAYVVPGAWAHVAATVQGRRIRVYHDGVLRDDVVMDIDFVRGNFDGRLFLGRAAWKNDYHFEGDLDDVRLSRVARYTGGSFPRPTAPLAVDTTTVALWRFDEPAGLTVADVTNLHHASSTSATTAPLRAAAPCVSAR